LCAGEEFLPLFGDADEGCQCEVQTDVGWHRIRILKLRVPMDDILF
jgi:hypothetical protein